MLSLSNFPAFSLGKVTVCEKDGHLCAAEPAVATQTISHLLGDNNVSVVIGQESARPAHSIHTAKDAFSIHTGTLWQRLVSAYYEDSFVASVKELSGEDDVSPVITKLALYLLQIFEMFNKAKLYLPLQPKNSPLHTLDTSVVGSIGTVLMISWHPHACKLAAAFSDDTVRVFGRNPDLIPVLKHRLQKNVVHIEWMPYSASLLAVGCESGILLWTLDPVSVVSRPSGSCVTHLSFTSTLPTTSITWHPKGLSVACVGGKGRELVVWDVAKEEPCVVHSGFASCFSFLLWSPDGNRLLAAMNANAMRVFECQSWSYERWSLSHPLQSAVWSSSGHSLLFAIRNDSYLYSLNFTNGGEGVGGSQVAVQVADFTKIFFTTECGEEVTVGGPVKQLAWDSNSERLAVLFKESEYVALFQTYTYPQLHLAPGGFIQGEMGHTPVHISFQKNVIGGAVLTTAWSGGKVTHIPLRYTERETLIDVPFNSSLGQINQQTLYGSPPQNVSRFHDVTLGPSMSPFTSPLTRLFTSPS